MNTPVKLGLKKIPQHWENTGEFCACCPFLLPGTDELLNRGKPQCHRRAETLCHGDALNRERTE